MRLVCVLLWNRRITRPCCTYVEQVLTALPSSLSPPLTFIFLMSTAETGPNLRELIHEYIVQMQPPLSSQWRALTNTTEHGDVEVMSYDDEPFNFTKAQNRLVHMSRIRRMCRLLVDCDDNTTSKKAIEEEAEEESEENEEGEDPTPPTTSPPITAGTGTVAMARCWRDIVHMEVTQTLKKFDSTDSPHMVASDVLNIYNQLKQAMLELFGGHSQFALALKEGFSKAFQSLDEVTGVRVSGACVHVCAVGVNLLHRNLVPLLLPLVL